MTQNTPQNEAVEIRALGSEDIDKYRELRLRGLEEHPEAFGETADHFKSISPELLINRLNRSQELGGCTLVARNSVGRFVGTVSLGVTDAKKMSHRGVLWGMYVDSASRGIGLGRQLLEECVSRALTTPGLEMITLSVVTTNEVAFNLYKAQGFDVYGTDPAVLRIGSSYFDEYLMVKFLRDNDSVRRSFAR
jgi:ribosomal protein S18 acetylase RimI-like enzyme